MNAAEAEKLTSDFLGRSAERLSIEQDQQRYAESVCFLKYKIAEVARTGLRHIHLQSAYLYASRFTPVSHCVRQLESDGFTVYSCGNNYEAGAIVCWQ